MKNLIKTKNKKKLNQLIKKMHPHDIIEQLNKLTEDEVNTFYSLLEEDEVARIVAYLEPEEAAEIIDNFDLEEQKEIIENLDLDDAADIFVHLEQQLELINTLDNEELISKVLEYEEHQVGSQMSDSFITLTLDMDIKSATKKVISEADQVDNINLLFVIDSNNKFIGTVELKSLIKAKEPLTIEDLVKSSPFVYDTDDTLESIHKIQNYGSYEMPVLNKDNELIGVLTVDDAIEIFHEEAVDDFEKLMILPDSTTKGLFKTAVKRLPWLLLLLVLSVPIALATSSFENVITAVAVLALFQPLILDAAGDVATQTLAVTLRILSKEPKKALKNGYKEIVTGIIIGIIIGISGAVISYLIANNLNTVEPFNVSLVVGLSLMLTIISGPLFALFIPIFLNKINIDPAIASGPFITTLIDIASVFIYFGLATLLLGVL